MKNKYHPLLKQKYFLGVLNDYEISLIRRRTFYSWNNINENGLVGFNPNDPLISEKEVFVFMHQQGHVRKLLKAYMSVFTLFRSILKSIPGWSKKLIEHRSCIIKTYRVCKNFITTGKFGVLTGISAKKINRWENEIHCENSFLDSCKAKNPTQLTLSEQNITVESLSNPGNDHLFICDIWAELSRTGKLRCKLGTFYKYARIAVKKLGLRKRKAKKPVHSIIATAPLKILHVDCTIIRTDDGGKWYLNIIYDNFCKAILGIKAMLNPNSCEVATNLKSVIEEYGLQNKKISLYCDGGPENKKHVDDLLLNYPKIKKLVTSFSNGVHNNMIESYNSKFKRRHIRLLDLSRHSNIPEQLEYFKSVFNNTPQALIGTLTPDEILSGLRPWIDIWPNLENDIKVMRQDRILTNKLSCCAILPSNL